MPVYVAEKVATVEDPGGHHGVPVALVEVFGGQQGLLVTAHQQYPRRPEPPCSEAT